MLKNVMAYRIGNDVTREVLSSVELIDALMENLTEPPHKTQWYKYGYAMSEKFGVDSPVFNGAMGARVLLICRQDRVLPGRVIQQEVAARVARLYELNGVYPHKKEMAELKDDAVAKLLPKAFVKASYFQVLITQDWVFVETSSTKTADEIICYMRDTLAPESGLRLFPLSAIERSPWLKEVALPQSFVPVNLDDEPPYAPFRHLGSAALKGKDVGTVRLKDVDFDDEDVNDVITNSSRWFTELAMAWRDEGSDADDLQFNLNNHLIIKRLEFSDILIKQANDESDREDVVSHFDATVAIASDRIVKLVNAIADATRFNEVFEDDISPVGLTPKHVSEGEPSEETEEEEQDALYDEAVEFVTDSRKSSTSALQRHLRIGYNRAARLIETMEENGVVSSTDASGCRTVLAEETL
jgi:recombination associated protein RdgC